MIAGECACQEDYLPYKDKRGFLYCYQEYLQGPCQEGQQFIQPDIAPAGVTNVKPVCVPTDCGKDEIRYQGNCFPVVKCNSSEVVTFDLDKLTTNCEEYGVGLRQLINFRNSCNEPGKTLFNGECIDTDESQSQRPNRDVTFNGGGGNFLCFVLKRC